MRSLTAIDSEAHTGDVTLDAATTAAPYGGGDINPVSSLSAVPIEYMDCHSAAFEVGDHVLIQFAGQQWNAPKIIGFHDRPKGCGFYVQIWANGEPGPGGDSIRFWSETDQGFSASHPIPENGIVGPFALENLGNPQLFCEHDRFGRHPINLLSAPEVPIDLPDGSTAPGYLFNFQVSILLTEWTFGLFRMAHAWDLVWDRPAEMDGFVFPMITRTFEDEDAGTAEWVNERWEAYRDAMEQTGSRLWTWQSPRVYSSSYGMIIPEIPYCISGGEECQCADLCEAENNTVETTDYDWVLDCGGVNSHWWPVGGSTVYDEWCFVCANATLRAQPYNIWPRPESVVGMFKTKTRSKTGSVAGVRLWECDGRWNYPIQTHNDIEYHAMQTCPLGDFPDRTEHSVGVPPVASGEKTTVSGGGCYSDTEIFQVYVEHGPAFSGWEDAGGTPPEEWILEVKSGYESMADTAGVNPVTGARRMPAFEASLRAAVADVHVRPENIAFWPNRNGWYVLDSEMDPETGFYQSVNQRCLMLINLVRPGEWSELVGLHNDHRVSMGLERLTWNGKLADAARRHADDIAANLSESHYGSDGSDPMERIRDTGYYDETAVSWQAWENTAYFPVDSPLSDVFQGWLASPPHRSAIEMAVLEEIGIAAANGADGRRYYVVCFGQVEWG